MGFRGPKNVTLGSQKYVKNFSKIFFEKFFDQKHSKTLNFWPFLFKNSIYLVSLQSSIDIGTCAIAQNDRNTILMKWAKKIKYFTPKIQEIDFLAKKVFFKFNPYLTLPT